MLAAGQEVRAMVNVFRRWLRGARERATPGRDGDRATRLRHAAQLAWAQALEDFYTPPLPDVIVEYEPDGSSFFYIDPKTWTVHLNTAGVPEGLTTEEEREYLRSVCHHEMQHYLLCPYDGPTHARMFNATRKHVSAQTGMFVCNLFADLVVDSFLMERFPGLTRSRVQASIASSASAVDADAHSDLWRLAVTCYRQMWGFEIPPHIPIDTRTKDAATRIVQVARERLRDERRWPKATAEIAKIIAEWEPEVAQELSGAGQVPVRLVPGGTGDHDPDRTAPVRVPVDVDALMGDPTEVRDGDRAKACMGHGDRDVGAERERVAIEVEQQGGSLEDLRVALGFAGLDGDREVALKYWYRAKVRGMLEFDVSRPKHQGDTPVSPVVWRLGDPAEQLDVVQSLQTFPLLIPNVTTRKWDTTSLSGHGSMPGLPDMLLVIDSSGSMEWSVGKKGPRGPYHTALLCAFAAASVAFRKGCSVAAINFSDDCKTTKWTRERDDIERVLLDYQGGGTVAPTDEVVALCRGHPTAMVLTITDAEIYNWDEFIDMVRQITNMGHLFFMFYIGRLDKEVAAALESAGGHVVSVRRPRDLEGLVIREVRRIYVDREDHSAAPPK